MSQKSNKSYTFAVILCMVFGIIGIHHFYVKRYGHGFFDLGLFLSAMYLFYFKSEPWSIALGVFFLIIDFIHTLYVTILLLTGQYKDGEGNLITYPNQKI